MLASVSIGGLLRFDRSNIPGLFVAIKRYFSVFHKCYMYLMSDWEGQTKRYLAGGHGCAGRAVHTNR